MIDQYGFKNTLQMFWEQAILQIWYGFVEYLTLCLSILHPLLIIPPQLSFQHPETETKDLITPVKVKLQMKNQKCLTYNDINQIKYKVVLCLDLRLFFL